MKKLGVFLMLSMFVVTGALAQGNFENNPKVKEMRKKFYNKELIFTDAEAQAFWPLFNEFQKKERLLRRQYKSDTKPANEDEADKQIKLSLEYDQKKSELKKEYLDKFSKVLPVRKVAMLEATERKFKREVLKKVRENRQKRNK